MTSKSILLISIFFTSALLGGTPSQAASSRIDNGLLSAELDGKTITLQTEQAGKHPMSATLELPEPVGKASVEEVSSPTWGKGRQLVLNHGDNATTLTLYESNPFAYFETTLGNSSTQFVDVSKRTMATMQFDLGVDGVKLRTLGTGGWCTSDDPPLNSYAYLAVADPDSRNGVISGWLTQLRGAGLMFPIFQSGAYHLRTDLDFGNLRIPANGQRKTDILLIGFFADARLGLEQYADAIAKVYDIRLQPKPKGVYCTWYHRKLDGGGGSSTEKLIAENAVFAKKHLAPFGLDVFQIDDQWQDYWSNDDHPNMKIKKTGPIKNFTRSGSRYPGGMAHTAEVLQENGFVPGIWYTPFAGNKYNPSFDPEIFAKVKGTGEPYHDDRWSGACIDSTSPKGEAFLHERFKRIHDWGYRYIKVDALHTGTPSPNIYVNRDYKTDAPVFANAEIYDKSKTFIEEYRMGLGILREENPDTFILGCAATQNMVSFAPVFGMVDAMRVGPDNDGASAGMWQHVVKGADYAGNLWFLNNRVWFNDPDPFYVREENPLPMARWMASWQAVSGVLNTTSMQYEKLPPERLDIIKRTLPTHCYNARPVDILENKHPAIWLVSNVRMHLIGLFNWEEHKKTDIDYALDRMGLDGGKDFEAFDFWDNRYLGTISKRLKTELPEAGCQVIALREVTDHPQVVSTSRHITQGLIDVISEEWLSNRKLLRGSSNVVASDPYELRIVCPPGFKAGDAMVSDKSATVAGIKQDGKLLRITIVPAATGTLDWVVRF